MNASDQEVPLCCAASPTGITVAVDIPRERAKKCLQDISK